jgi:phosphate transport system permease protein
MKRNKLRFIKDRYLNGLTYLSSGISVVALSLIFIFVFSRGWSTLNWNWFTNDYWSVNMYLALPEASQNVYNRPTDLSNTVYYSSKYGFGVSDYVDEQNLSQIKVIYIDPESPLGQASILTNGPDYGTANPIEVNMLIQKFTYVDTLGITHSAGSIIKQNSAQFIETLESKSVSVQSAYVQTIGGGIRGSLIATLLLILLSLLIALPLGIMSAIYINEYASHGKLTPWIRSSIELLTGVPSIIFGLMGMLVLYPITALAGANGTSILLGSLTLSIVLLPTIIRATEESLKTVPDHFRSASLSLGANMSQTIFKIVLPSAIPGILTGVLLSIGRIIGESAALIYTMGTFINDDPSILKGGTSLAVQIWSVMGGEQPNFELASAISIVILVIVLFMNVSMKFIANRLRKTW